MRKIAAFAGTIALAAAGVASADYTGTTVMNMGEIVPGTNTYRIFVNFSSPDDRLLAISGNDTVSALRYSGAELVQNAPGFESLDLQDKPFAASLPGDSWVTIGGNFEAGLTDLGNAMVDQAIKASEMMRLGLSRCAMIAGSV